MLLLQKCAKLFALHCKMNMGNPGTLFCVNLGALFWVNLGIFFQNYLGILQVNLLC